MSRTVLIIDDEQAIRDSLSGALSDEGFKVMGAASGPDGLEALKQKAVDIVLLDIWMPGQDGLETLKLIRTHWPEQIVVMMSGHGNIETAVKATKLGAYDFVEKPLSLERLLVILQNAASFTDLARENQALRKQIEKNRSLIGHSPAIMRLKELIGKVAKTMGSVLITGENGTGKELVAHSIHALSPRFNRPFVDVNCAAIPEELIESELFGHEKGAFTGATQLRRGKFDLANGGTLFLDEIGDMSLKTQAKILRILQEQRFERVGGTQTLQVDVRIIAATNKELKTEIAEGQFREDLYYRLNVVPFHVPPLRERKEDLRVLADHFLNEFSITHGRPVGRISEATVSLLERHNWPGNVRELKNLLERVVILSDGEGPVEVRPDDVLPHLELDEQDSSQIRLGRPSPVAGTAAGTSSGKALKEARTEFEREWIVNILTENGWNISKAAQILGIERTHLHRKIKAMKIEQPPEE